MLSLPFIVILLTVGERVCARDYNWVKPVHRECLNGQVVSYIEGSSSNIRCKGAWSLSCYWTGDVNDFNQPLDFNCPHRYVIAGMHYDGRWRYKCCRSFYPTQSYVTNYVNAWRAPAANYYLTGVIRHRNNRRQELWKFKYCSVTVRSSGRGW